MIINKIKQKIRSVMRPKFIENIVEEGKFYPYRALLYYKTGWFLKDYKLDYKHTNEWEIIEIVKILNSLGFAVDVVDRGLTDFLPDDKYQLFIGLAAGDSGKYYADYARLLSSAVKVALCAGPEPTLSARLVREQYERFNRRHHTSIPTMREPTIDFDSFVEVSDALLVIGEENTFCPRSYSKHDIPIHTYLPGCSSNIRFIKKWLSMRDRKKFICFAGNGFICKGVDLVVEAFSRYPELSVHICGPDDEAGFFEVLGPIIECNDNIHYEGFVEVGSEKFESLASSCSYVIFNSSAEGVATSVTSMMIAGLVPVVNYETGIALDDFGLAINNGISRVDAVEKSILDAVSMSDEEYESSVYGTLNDSMKYTQQSFSVSFKMSILNIISKHLG